MNKFAYIIPGYGESHKKQKGYDKVADFFNAQGIKPIHVNIKWNLKTPRDFEKYNEQFLKRFKKKDNDEAYVLGFSYGAVIAFLTEPKTKPTALILCSLSPYFVEDYKNLKPTWLKWWKKNFENDYFFNEPVKNISTKTYLVAGDKEHPSALMRAKDAKKKIKRSSLVIAKGAKHRIGQKEYLDTLGKLIRKI